MSDQNRRYANQMYYCGLIILGTYLTILFLQSRRFIAPIVAILAVDHLLQRFVIRVKSGVKKSEELQLPEGLTVWTFPGVLLGIVILLTLLDGSGLVDLSASALFK